MKTDEFLKQAEENENESSISSAEKNFADERQAAQVFSSLKTKLLNIEEWNARALISSYEVFSESGEHSKTGKIAAGVLIRLLLKGSGKYDWIRVIDISETEDEFIITVKPTFDPTAETSAEKTTSHFFTGESANNFCLCRKGLTVALRVIGLSEKQNTSETGGVLETIRNVAVNLGTYMGIQKSEWEKFCRHFLEDAAEEIAAVSNPK